MIGLLVDKQTGDTSAGRTEGGTGVRPDAVLRGGRRPGGRPRRAVHAHTASRRRTVESTRIPGCRALRCIASRPPRRSQMGDVLRAEVAGPLRDSTRRNHTATHLLHAALRQVLGTHVKQAGSVVEPPRLRFDFTHYAALDPAELEEIERLVNEQILRNTQVDTNVMPLDQAISTGAMALFGEKYGEQVRVVSVPGSAASCAAARTCAAPAISASARSSTRAAFRRACGASRRLRAKRRCGSIRNHGRAEADRGHAAVSRAGTGGARGEDAGDEHAQEAAGGAVEEKIAQSASAGLEAQARRDERRAVLAAGWTAWIAGRCGRWRIRCAISGRRRWWCWHRRRRTVSRSLRR